MGFLEAVRFLTVLPLPSRHAPSEMSVARSLAYFPLVGLLLGALLAAIDRALRQVWSTEPAAALVLAIWIALTGGIHLDGLADTADGLLGGHDREQRLAIMRDSRLGAFGALALFAVLLFKFALLGGLPSGWRSQSLLLAPVVGRWVVVQAIVFYPAARPGGAGHLFQQHADVGQLLVASAIALAAAFATFRFWGLAIAVGLSILAVAVGSIIARSLGGLTGDTYGALCELGEAATLATVAALAGKGLL